VIRDDQLCTACRIRKAISILRSLRMCGSCAMDALVRVFPPATWRDPDARQQAIALHNARDRGRLLGGAK
jgi:hypothetical protein